MQSQAVPRTYMYIQPLVICKCSKCLSTTLKYSIRHRHADYMYNTVKVVTCTEESIYDVNACNIHAHIQCTCILEAVGVALLQTSVSINTQRASTSNTVHAGVADRLIQAHTTQCGCTTLGEITKQHKSACLLHHMQHMQSEPPQMIHQQLVNQSTKLDHLHQTLGNGLAWQTCLNKCPTVQYTHVNISRTCQASLPAPRSRYTLVLVISLHHITIS